MNWMKKHQQLNLSVWIGLLLIITALSIWIFSIAELEGNEIKLTTQNLSIDEIWRYEGALQWWKNVYMTAIIPATAVLALSGIASILSQQLFSRLAQKDTLTKFEETIKQSCQINPD